MRLHLIAVGTRVPDWVAAGFEDYARRFPPHCPLRLNEVPTAARRGSGTTARARGNESARLLARVPEHAVTVALDAAGRAWSTQQLAGRLKGWRQDGRDVAFLVGGPDGLAADVLERCELRWSLGPLTLPHALVRVIVAEQLYRAWSILERHPYHRA